MSRRYALVIGISDYRAPLAPLSKTASDARAIATLLRENGSFQDVKLLAETVTRNDLNQALQRFLLEQATANDALIYFTGHGITVVDEGVFLATSDGDVEVRGNQVIAQKYCFPLRKLNDLIHQANLSSLVVFLDCCHSGRFLDVDPVQQSLAAFRDSKDYFFITACRGFEDARARKSETHSVFTGALLDALAPRHVGNDGQISGEFVLDYLRKELHGSGQEPIRLGYGRSLPIVFYPIPDTPTTTEPFNPQNPYVGLAAFELEQAAYFYGRSQEVRELLARLDPLHIPPRRFLAVLGPSGCGKSSLVKAGLLPELAKDGLPGSQTWTVEAITPGQTPKAALTAAIRKHSDDKPYVLFIDQFEELFTLCQQEDERREFLTLLKQEATAGDRQTRVVITMRGDFLDRCAKYQESTDLINQTQPTAFVVTPLTTDKLITNLEDVIEKPAAMHGVTFQKGLVSQIVSDVLGQPGAMPLLQYALTELWNICIPDKNAEPCLTHAGYTAIGGVKGALQRRADALYNGFTQADQTLVRQLLLKLVQIGDGEEVTRRRATWEELRESLPAEQTDRIVDQLAKQRLIMADEKTVEVAHEALLSEWSLLKGWIDADRDDIRTEARFKASCQEWLEKSQPDDYLLTGGRLADVEDWIKKTTPNLPERQAEFLKRSLERRDREQQTQLEQERQLRESAEAKARAEEEARQKAEAAAIAEVEARQSAEKALAEEQKSLKAEQQRLKAERQRTRSVILAALGITTISMLGAIQWRAADQEKIRAQTNFARASFTVNRDTFDALSEALKAGKELKQSSWFRNDPSLQSEVLEVLAQTTNWVKEYNRLEGHKNFVWAVAFSPDGQTLATGGADNTLRIWSAEGQEKLAMKDHANAVTGISFSQGEKGEGKFLATCSKDGSIKIRDARTGQVLKSLEGRKSTGDDKDDLWRVRFSPDAKTVAAVSEAGFITLWEWQSDRLPKIWQAHPSTAYDVDFSPDGRTIATAGNEGVIKLWDRQGKLQGQPLSGHTQAVTTVRFSPSGTILASGSKDSTVVLWNWQTRIKQKTLRGHNRALNDVQFSADGQKLATSGDDAVIFLWDQNGNLVTTLKRHQEKVTSLSFSPDGQRLASASIDSTVKLWQIQPHIRVLKGYAEAVYMVSIKQPDGQLFATDGEQNLVKLWRSDGTLQTKWREPKPVYSIDFSSKQNMIAVTNGEHINLRNLQGQLIRKSIAQHNGPVLGVSISPDGQTIATASADNLAKLWNLTGQQQAELKGHTKEVYSVRFSPDGQTVATASWDGTVKLWNLQGGLKHTLQASESQVYQVGFSPDSDILAVVGNSPLVKLWKSDGTPLSSLEGHTKGVMDVSFSPNGKLIATGSNDGSIKLWNRDSTLFMTLLRQEQPINALRFTPDNRWLIAGSGNQEVLLIDVNNLTLEGLMQRGCDHLRDYKNIESLCKN